MTENERQAVIATMLRVKPDEAIIAIKTIAGGLSNKSFHVTTDKAEYFVRLPGSTAQSLIDRKNEKAITFLVNDLDIDAKLYFFDDDAGIKVSEYLSNAIMTTTEDFLDDNITFLAGKTFKKLHSAGFSNVMIFDTRGMLRTYEKAIQDHANQGFKLYDDYADMKIRVFKLMNDFKPSKLVLCHNDAAQTNWMKAPGRIYLIDWEFAGMNDPMWDLADLSIEANFNDHQDDVLLKSYFATDNVESMKQAMLANKIYIDFVWSTWGKVMSINDGSSMEEYALNRYIRMKANMQKAGIL